MVKRTLYYPLYCGPASPSLSSELLFLHRLTIRKSLCYSISDSNKYTHPPSKSNANPNHSIEHTKNNNNSIMNNHWGERKKVTHHLESGNRYPNLATENLQILTLHRRTQIPPYQWDSASRNSSTFITNLNSNIFFTFYNNSFDRWDIR